MPHKNKRGQGHQIKQTNKQTKGTTDKPQAAHNAQRHTTHTLFRALSNDETSSGSAEHRLRSHSTTLVWPTDAASCNAFQPSLGRYASECPASAYVVSTRKSPSRAALRNAWPSGLGFGRDCCQCDTHAHNTPHVRGRHSHNNNKSKQKQKKKKKRGNKSTHRASFAFALPVPGLAQTLRGVVLTTGNGHVQRRVVERVAH
mgnify:CR=1 FL=1